MHPQRILKSNSPLSVNVTLFGDMVLAEDHVMLRSLEQALTQYNNVLIKKGGVGHKTDMCREKMMWRHRKNVM